MPACQYLQIILSPQGCSAPLSSPLIIWTNCNPKPGKNLFEDFSFLFKLKSQSVSEDKFFSTMGWGGEGERSGHRVVFLSQDIVGSISCWCEGEGEVRTQVSRDQYRTDRMINISVGSIFISIIEREKGSWTHWTNTVALRWQVSSPPRSRRHRKWTENKRCSVLLSLFAGAGGGWLGGLN